MGNEITSIRDRMSKAIEPFYQSIMKYGGYAPDYMNKLRSSVMGTLGQSKMSDTESINRNVNALGMGGTGLGLRNQRALSSDYAKRMSSANRDIELDSRNELWRGVEGYQNMFNDMAGMTSQQKQLDQNGFWGSFKRGLGSGLAGMLTSGLKGK